MRKLIISFMIVMSNISCTPSQCAQPANANSIGCKVEAAVLDCTVGEIPSVIAVAEPLLLQLIKEHMSADGSVDWSSIDLKSLGTTYGSCVLGDLFTNKKAGGVLAKGEVAMSPDSLKAQLDKVRGGKTVHTANGDIK